MGRPPRISRESLVEAALQLGLADLSLKAVAAAVGVTTQALYHHIDNLEQLGDLVAEALMHELDDVADDGGDWRDWAERFAYSLKSLFETAPGLAEHVLRRRAMRAPSFLVLVDRSIKVALRSGFTPQNANWANLAVMQQVAEFVARDQRRRKNNEPPAGEAELREEWLRWLANADTAYVDLLRRQPSVSRDVRFSYSLRSLISGLWLHRADAAPERDLPTV